MAAQTHRADKRVNPPRAFIAIEISSVLLALRTLRTADVFPVVASLPPMERSDDRKYVCCS